MRGHNFLELLESFSSQVRQVEKEAGDISTRPRKALGCWPPGNLGRGARWLDVARTTRTGHATQGSANARYSRSLSHL